MFTEQNQAQVKSEAQSARDENVLGIFVPTDLRLKSEMTIHPLQDAILGRILIMEHANKTI